MTHGIYSSPVGSSKRIFAMAVVAVLVLCAGTGWLLARLATRATSVPSPGPPRDVAGTVMRRACRALYLYHVRNTWSWDAIVAGCASCPGPEILYAEYLERRADENFILRSFDFALQEGCTDLEAALPPHDFFGKIEPFGDGGFHIHVAERDGARIRVRIVEFSPRAFRVIEAWLELDGSPYTPPAAVVVGGSLEIHGRPEAASVAANGDVRVFGSAGFPLQARANAALPQFDARDYAQDADYRMDALGRVTDRAGNVLRAQPDRRVADDAGVWFVEGDAILDERAPSRVTVYATGSVTIDGALGLAAASNDVLVAAMGDLLVRGRPGSTFRGLLLAREQVKLVGQSEIEGAVVACHEGNLHRLFDGPDSVLGGHTRIRSAALSPLRAQARLVVR